MRNVLNFTLALIFSIFCVSMYTGCKIESPADPVVIDHGEDLPPEDPPIDEPVDLSSVILALYDGTTLRLWDGTIMTNVYTGNVVSAGERKLAFEDVLYYFDESGNTAGSRWLPVVPTAVVASESVSVARAAVIYDDTVLTLEDIPPEEAYALGARYKHYTRIFENGVEVGAWYLNEWECTDVIQTASGHILGINEHGAYVNLTDDKNVVTAYEGGIMTYNMGTQHGYIADASGEYEVTWSMNYFDNSRYQLADGVWYTENGYEWTPETGVISAANVMYNWNEYQNWPDTYTDLVAWGNNPYLLPAGVRAENGEEVTYWIETVTGQLYRHIPSIDRLDMILQLFEHDYTRMGAIPYFNTLDPVIIEDLLYYHEGGSIKTYDFTTGLVSIFSSDQEVIAW